MVVVAVVAVAVDVRIVVRLAYVIHQVIQNTQGIFLAYLVVQVVAAAIVRGSQGMHPGSCPRQLVVDVRTLMADIH